MAFVRPCGFVRRLVVLASTLVVLLPAARAQAPAVDPEASFQNRVQPIVFKNCNGCHTFGGHAGELAKEPDDELLALDDALTRLAVEDAVAAKVVELHHFAIVKNGDPVAK